MSVIVKKEELVAKLVKLVDELVVWDGERCAYTMSDEDIKSVFGLMEEIEERIFRGNGKGGNRLWSVLLTLVLRARNEEDAVVSAEALIRGRGIKDENVLVTEVREGGETDGG
jgi:hypothetical protein